jgi:murein L,D-transpeptidase YafK
MELEVWLSDSIEYKLYKTYKICKLSGDLGPKRREGDLQVPEGFYYINDFNPNSQYHLSLGVSYPNESDKILSPYRNLGGNIYIHGNCVSVGCIAMGDKNIEEIYGLAKMIKNRIDVHIFPIHYRYLSSLVYFDEKIKKRLDLIEFEQNIFKVYEYFEENNILPKIKVMENGLYSFE